MFYTLRKETLQNLRRQLASAFDTMNDLARFSRTTKEFDETKQIDELRETLLDEKFIRKSIEIVFFDVLANVIQGQIQQTSDVRLLMVGILRRKQRPILSFGKQVCRFTRSNFRP